MESWPKISLLRSWVWYGPLVASCKPTHDLNLGTIWDSCCTWAMEKPHDHGRELGALYIFILHVDLFCCHYLYVEVLIGCMNIYIYVNVHLVCEYNLVYMEICRTASSGDPGEVWWPQLSCQGEHRTEFFWKSGLFRTRIREMRTNKLVVSWKHPAAWLRGNKVEGISSYKKMSPEFPERGSVFDWVFNGEVG